MKRNNFIKKSMTIGVVTACMLICSVLCAQPQRREIGDFNRVTLAIPAVLEITQGAEQSLSLEGPAGILEKVITGTDNGRLRIYSKGPSAQFSDVKIYLTVKDINDLTLVGAGDIVSKSLINTNQINLEISGSGNIKIPELSAETVELQIAGSGNISAEGLVKEQIDVNITGSGDISVSKLETKLVDINITGSGAAEVFASEKLHTNIVGSGSVYYKGNPVVDANSVGSGRTKPL